MALFKLYKFIYILMEIFSIASLCGIYVGIVIYL